MSEKRKDSKGRVLWNGEVQRSDGKYMFRYVDSNGKRHSVYSWKLVSTDKLPDGKRCEKALRDIEKEIRRDIDDDIRTTDASTISVNDLFASFMELRVDLRTTTRCNYVCLYDKHVRSYLGSKKLRAVKFTDIQKLYVDMVQNKNLKTSTVQSVHSILYQMFESATMDNIIRVNPSANVLKSLKKMLNVGQEKRHALTEEEQKRLLNYVYSSAQHKRWAPIITILLGTGMRIGEALGLRWCDCDFKKDIISINHALLYKPRESGGYEYRISETKTTAGLRIIPMFLDVRRALLKEKNKSKNTHLDPFVVDNYTDFVFLNNCGKVFTPAAVFDAIQNITSSYNREEFFIAANEHREPCYLPKFSAHILRHTFCTRMCENENNIKVVQDVMGHKSSRTTMDVYNEATIVKKIASFKSIEGKIKLA